MAITNQGSFIEWHSVSPDFYSRRLENEKFDIALCLTSRSIVNQSIRLATCNVGRQPATRARPPKNGWVAKGGPSISAEVRGILPSWGSSYESRGGQWNSPHEEIKMTQQQL